MGKWKSFCAAVAVFGLVAAAIFVWMRMPVSDQELLANFAKAGDFFRGVQSVGGLPWWSPNFLQGTSLAMAWGYMFSNVVMLAAAACSRHGSSLLHSSGEAESHASEAVHTKAFLAFWTPPKTPNHLHNRLCT
jgi:hypothetical protein